MYESALISANEGKLSGVSNHLFNSSSVVLIVEEVVVSSQLDSPN